MYQFQAVLDNALSADSTVAQSAEGTATYMGALPSTTHMTERAHATLRARNVGGITQTTVDLPPGVTVLTGRNATNRTSFLQAIVAALGSQNVSLKADADTGVVELELDGEHYVRRLERGADGTVVIDGDPYLSDVAVADLFAFLLESNAAHRTVVTGQALRSVLMRPVDTDEIRAEIRDQQARKRAVEADLADLDDRETDRRDLERRRADLEAELDEFRSELASVTDEIDGHDLDIDASESDPSRIETLLSELEQRRDRLATVRSDIEVVTESIQSLEAERRDLEADLEATADTDEDDSIADRIESVRERKRRLDGEIRSLQEVIQFNEQMLDGEASNVPAALSTEGSSPTDDLTEETVSCWTCGTAVERTQVEATVETLQQYRQEKLAALDDAEAELDELGEQRRERERLAERRRRLTDRLPELQSELRDRRDRRDRLVAQRDDLTAEIDDLEAEIEGFDTERYDEILGIHRDATWIELRVEQLETELDDVRAELSALERTLGRRERLEAQRESIADELRAARTRIDRLEADAIEAFNDHMASLLSLLDYTNLERIWLERVSAAMGRPIEDRSFELHVVRDSSSGESYEDIIAHLSESEREVAGLVVALAGYFVHDVHETVPFMILDSLEAIDADRIAALLDYFAEYVPYLVVALLPEDAQAVDDGYNRVTDI